MVMPIVDYVCPGLDRVHIITFYESNYLLIGLDLIFSHNNALRLVPVTRPVVPLTLSNLVYLETRLWVHVQYVPQNLL